MSEIIQAPKGIWAVYMEEREDEEGLSLIPIVAFAQHSQEIAQEGKCVCKRGDPAPKKEFIVSWEPMVLYNGQLVIANQMPFPLLDVIYGEEYKAPLEILAQLKK